MAETYRRSKIEAYRQRLEVRVRSLRTHLQETALSDKRDFLQGQLTALELVLQELSTEFELDQHEAAKPKES